MQLEQTMPARGARIEMIPMMDVVFQLLVFFIYAMLAMVLHRGMKVNLPFASSSMNDRQEYVAVSITKANELFVNRVPTTLEGLPAAVQQAREAAPTDGTTAREPLPVFISGDRDADLGIALQVLDRLRQASIHEVAFETREQPGQ